MRLEVVGTCGSSKERGFHLGLASQSGTNLFLPRLWGYRMPLFIGRKGNCWKNSPMESLLRSLSSKWMLAQGYAYIADISLDASCYRCLVQLAVPPSAQRLIPPMRAELNLKSKRGSS